MAQRTLVSVTSYRREKRGDAQSFA